jgi:hypothetical protein
MPSRNTGQGGSGMRANPTPDPVGVELVIADVPEAGSNNFDLSMTGRISNELYDVVLVDVALILAKDDLTRTLQEISSGGFLTIRDLKIERADVYGSLQQGYLYGATPVVRVDLTIETIWLRSWTKDFMPDVVRAGLGIDIDKSDDEDDDDADDDGRPEEEKLMDQFS